MFARLRDQPAQPRAQPEPPPVITLKNIVLRRGVKVLLDSGVRRGSDVVKALNALGATPGDLLAILQAIKAAGALNAELEVI